MKLLPRWGRLGFGARRGMYVRGSLAVGVDLGTTNSAVSVLRNGVPVVVPNEIGKYTTPSVVTYLPNGEVVVGQRARQLAAQHPDTTFSSIKRILGKDYDRVKEEQQQLIFEVMPGDVGKTLLRCDVCPGGILRPEDVSAEIIQYLIQCVKNAFDGEVVDRCVISVPAYFDELQREATVTACARLGLLSGLEKVRLIQEPVASALAYGVDLMKDQTVCVFDLGGGTLDICVLELGNGVTEVLATGGNSHLGGDDVDAAIVQWLMKEHLSNLPGLQKTTKFMSNLKRLAEAAKIRLSTGSSILIKIPTKDEKHGMRLTRDQLEKLCGPLYIEMRSALDRCCWQAGIDLVSLKDVQQKNDLPVEIRVKERPPVSEILLVGAATKMPAIRRFLENMTGLDVRESNVDPDQCVAMGAAIEAGRLGGELSQEFMLMDVWQAAMMRALAKEQIREQKE